MEEKEYRNHKGGNTIKKHQYCKTCSSHNRPNKFKDISCICKDLEHLAYFEQQKMKKRLAKLPGKRFADEEQYDSSSSSDQLDEKGRKLTKRKKKKILSSEVPMEEDSKDYCKTISAPEQIGKPSMKKRYKKQLVDFYVSPYEYEGNIKHKEVEKENLTPFTFL